MVADKVFSGLFTVCRDTFVCYIQWVNTSSPCAQGFGEPLGKGRSYANSWSSWNRAEREIWSSQGASETHLDDIAKYQRGAA